MKKLILILFVLACFLIPSTGFADWTCTAARYKGTVWGEARAFWQRVYFIKVECESDGADPAEFLLSSILDEDEMQEIRGGALYRVITDQGAQAPETYTVTFDDSFGADIKSITTTSVSQAERFAAGSEILWDLQIDFGDIGDSGEDAILYLLFVR